MKNHWVSAILAALLIVGLFAALPVGALAAGGGTGITLGTGAIIAGNKVYFGNQDLWRVLGNGTGDTADQGALLISDNTLERIQFDNNNQWQGSSAQEWCTKYYTNWANEIEKGAILATSVTEKNDKTESGISYYYKGGHGHNKYFYGAASLNKEYFFFLSAEEADTLFTDDNDRKAAGSGTWWLRSPIADDGGAAGVVDFDGWVVHQSVDNNLETRPAFNLNLSSVLFTSLIPSESNQYKLTLKDTALGATPGTITGKGKTVTVSYYNVTGSPTQLSVVMTDGTWSDSTGWSSGASVKYYGKLDINGSIGTSGTGTFDLPDGFFSSNGWKAYLVAKQVNGEKETDYAGAPVAFTIPKLDPVCNAPTGLTATYGQTLANVKLTNPTGNTPGKWKWSDSTQSVGNVVSPAATFKATFTPTDTTNYNTVENVDVAVTVKKADSNYTYTSGEGSAWPKNSGMPLVFRVKSSVDDSKTYTNFSKARVDGIPLTKDKDFTAYSGSVIIELKPDYLETLSVGEHRLTAEFTDGTAEAGFTVIPGSPVNLPRTGDGSNVFINVLVGLLALAGIGLIIKKK